MGLLARLLLFLAVELLQTTRLLVDFCLAFATRFFLLFEQFLRTFLLFAVELLLAAVWFGGWLRVGCRFWSGQRS